MTTAIKFENVSKQYRLGEVGTGTLSHDLHRAWARMRGKPDPFAKVGQVNNRAEKSDGDGADSKYVWALKDIDFEVEQGEILGIIGRNGAGKSTLLKLLSRVTAPTTGSIKAKGRIASLLEVGTGFHPELTGRENIYLNGAILGMRRHEITKQLDDIVAFSGCAKYIDTPVKRYSSGMTVRLGFAVAAHLDCEILVVDEVLAVGDSEFQKKCIGKMQEISHGKGKTVLFVSHNMNAVGSLCGRGCLLSRGMASSVMPIEDAISSYLTEAVLTETSLRNTKHLGSGKVKIVNLRTSGNAGHPVRTGQPFKCEMSFESEADEGDLKDLQFSFQIFDEYGSPLFLHHTRLNGNYMSLRGPRGSVVFQADFMPLLPGQYSCRYSIYNSTMILIDTINENVALTIEAGTVYRTTELPPRSHSLFTIANSRWHAEATSN